MKLGGYTINVMTTSFPQNVISGFDKAFEGMVGAQYDMIAYLGSKIVNGTNHAFLAKQTLVTGTDISSIVLVILNEKLDDIAGNTFSIVSIEPLLSNGGKLGGLNINPTTNIPEDAMDVFKKHFEGFVGINLEPFALLATQMVNGGAYVFAVKANNIVSPKSPFANSKYIVLMKIYANYKDVETIEVINERGNESKLGYAFTWLKSKESIFGDIDWR